ncbi:hypothetical protein ACGF0J_25780 [Nonomuraea sp. NPDC047897]|uniref:hypothetical protein n=1 Tax=Nonomuraea sp. NPDC047897 TaxID=3364346 RepID=UPI003718C0C1
MKRITIVLLALALHLGVVGPLPAGAAGNWAVTYLDPAPERFAPGTPYTVGYWVLQHGTHPYEGDDLGRTGLRLVGSGGRVLEFHGTALPEAGHYATAVAVPAGEWRVQGVQGRFEPHEVGTLRVPGGLTVHPLEKGLVEAIRSGGHRSWGVVRPPGFPAGVAGAASPSVSGAGVADAAPEPVGEPVTTSAGAPVTAPAGAPVRPRETGFPAYGLVLAAAGGALLALAALRLTGRLPGRRAEEDRPVDGRTETLSSHG